MKTRSLSREADARAFTVIEVLVALGICLSVLLVAFPAATNFYVWQAHQELKLAAATLSTAILQEQHHAICAGGSSGDYLMKHKDGLHYRIYRDMSPSGTVQLTHASRQKVHIETTELDVISFKASGVPRYYGQLLLRHEDLPKETLLLQVQPITGRVVING